MTHDISLAGWKDLTELIRVQRQIARETEHLAKTRSERSDGILYALAKAFLNRKRVHSFVAKENGKIVGYITVICGKFIKVRGTAYFVMGVLASHRGRGIGTQLLHGAEEFVRSQNMHRIELEVFENNVPARRLYEKAGYVAEGRRREAIRTESGYQDIIWMGKLLDVPTAPVLSEIQPAGRSIAA